MSISRARAVIIKDGKLLAMKRIKPQETFWCCPGGQVEESETHEQALIRECREELGVVVEPIKLLARIPSEKPETKGQVEYFYLCELQSGELGTGRGPEYEKDSGYIGAYHPEWIEISSISGLDFRPRQIGDIVASML